MPIFEVTFNNHFTDQSAPTPTHSSPTTPKPNTNAVTIKNSTHPSSSATKSTPATTKAPAKSQNKKTTIAAVNDLSTDSTNKRTTTAAPNSTATKGYKLENSTDDEAHHTSIHPINVPRATTEVSIKDLDPIFEPIIDGQRPMDFFFGPISQETNIDVMNHSKIETQLMQHESIPWSVFENVTVNCHMNRDCPNDEICIHSQCKGWCGPQKSYNCFPGTALSNFCK